jgi:uncharacterized protein
MEGRLAMNKDVIKKAVEMGSRLGHVFVATADHAGLPHVAASGRIEVEPGGRVAVSEWFCPGTLANLQANPKVSIVAWDPVNDIGFQILGVADGLEELAVMDGLSQDLRKPLPQVERKIHVRVEKIIDFRHAPHSDVEE